jgi:3-hydroxy-9,10-secoandrosta-1,3,5(10)-triene-9,17-dione monooxygenase reductase component
MSTVTAVEPGAYRRTLGHFCTGVTVVAAIDPEGEPVGFACQSFAALSLDPPLVLFCPGKGSRSWPAIESARQFTVNVLAHDQQDVSAVFGRAGADKFSSVAWHPAPSGAPLLDGVLAWLDCTLEDVVDGGDHHIVIGRVTALNDRQDGRPLLFYRGAYTATEEREPTPGIMDNLITWTRDDWF